MKKIWIMNHYGEPPTTGTNTRHFNFAKILTERGYSVKIFTSSTIHRTTINHITDNKKFLEKQIYGVSFVFIKTSNYKGNGMHRIKNMFDYAIGIYSETKKFDKPDIIYASSPHPLTWLSSYFIAKRYGAKFIVETRDLWPETLVAMGRIKKNNTIAKILYSLEKFIYKKADKLIFTFPGGKDYIKNIGLEVTKVRYINNGIDLEEFSYNKENEFFKDEDLDNNYTFKVLYTGAIGQANALNYLVEAAKIIQDKGIDDIRFILMGDGTERTILEEYINKKNIKNITLKKKTEKRYVPNILSKADVNILCLENLPEIFKFGLSPNKLFDYFSSGHPIISNAESKYDMLKEYNCGITVKGGSAEALAEGILQFYNMADEEYNEYCENALNAAKDFDFINLTDKLEKVLMED